MRHQPIISRAFTATIVYKDGRRITTTVYGLNVWEAEHSRDNDTTIKEIIVHSELR